MSPSLPPPPNIAWGLWPPKWAKPRPTLTLKPCGMGASKGLTSFSLKAKVMGVGPSLLRV